MGIKKIARELGIKGVKFFKKTACGGKREGSHDIKFCNFQFDDFSLRAEDSLIVYNGATPSATVLAS